jgi:hypothetical protein
MDIKLICRKGALFIKMQSAVCFEQYSSICSVVSLPNTWAYYIIFCWPVNFPFFCHYFKESVISFVSFTLSFHKGLSSEKKNKHSFDFCYAAYDCCVRMPMMMNDDWVST